MQNIKVAGHVTLEIIKFSLSNLYIDFGTWAGKIYEKYLCCSSEDLLNFRT
jgi:hypothetical protein